MIFAKKSKFHDAGGPDTVVSPTDINKNISTQHTDNINISTQHTDINKNLSTQHTDININISTQHTDINDTH